ncbi:MAG: STAS domain-containing protein [Desulfuromonadales bacterium]|nr:STAS domain-containing protein [Desulfuromonadales bacterium]
MDIKRNQSFDSFVFQGNIDIHAETNFKEIPALVEKTIVKLDFSQVGRINSMGIALLLRCFKKIREEKNAEIVLTGLNTIHTMLFKTTGVFLLASLDNNT